jgi:hypothetical protein
VAICGPRPTVHSRRPVRHFISGARCGACTAHCQRPTWPVPLRPRPFLAVRWRSDVRPRRSLGQNARRPGCLETLAPLFPLSVLLSRWRLEEPAGVTAAGECPTAPAGVLPATATVAAPRASPHSLFLFSVRSARGRWSLWRPRRRRATAVDGGNALCPRRGPFPFGRGGGKPLHSPCSSTDASACRCPSDREERRG